MFAWSFGYLGNQITLFIMLCSGVDPKSILCEHFKVGQCAKGFKCKFSHDLNVQRKGEKIDIYSDTREEGWYFDGLVTFPNNHLKSNHLQEF